VPDNGTLRLQFPASVYTVQPDTVCTVCSEPGEGEYVCGTCNPLGPDTKICDSSTCPCEDRKTCQYRTDAFVAGDSQNLGVDTQCGDCTRMKNDEWEVFKCGGDYDGLYKKCSTCMEGEYQQQECTITSDTVCPACNTAKQGPHAIEYQNLQECDKDERYCGADAAGKYGKEFKGGPDGWKATACEKCNEGFYGESCIYHKFHGECGTITTRERAANRSGFEGDTDEEFIQHCLELCDEFPDCMAFELVDGGDNLFESGPNSFLGRDATCFFKGAYTQELCDKKEPTCDRRTKSRYKGDDPTKDCYSNTYRQNLGCNPNANKGYCVYFPELAEYKPCGGKAEGDSCTTCPPGVDSCVETMEFKSCNADGECAGSGFFGGLTPGPVILDDVVQA